ncbi:MAG TPA: septal ring lytic transglycosylase RlpA family protein, partial [Methylophilaceae bacterium]|nr:septal ring lytic transglycosylase RlpA family protein [Methylophilaceae bacterium]HQC28797.1 septal ring lytic transglycosylase RlpA family protein [Methylotenera sp.]
KEKLKHPASAVSKHKSMVGLASFYAAKFHGRRTANGEIFNTHALTAAHLSLPFGTKVKVTNLRNGKSVVVRINDRGPHVRGRIIDLSVAAAKKIGLNRAGTARVKLEVLGK